MKVTMSNKQDISLSIETKVKELNITYLEACIQQANECDIDIEDLAPLLSRSIKDRLEVEAINSRVIRTTRPMTLEQFCD
jgi:hypothetical protein